MLADAGKDGGFHATANRLGRTLLRYEEDGSAGRSSAREPPRVTRFLPRAP